MITTMTSGSGADWQRGAEHGAQAHGAGEGPPADVDIESAGRSMSVLDEGSLFAARGLCIVQEQGFGQNRE